MTGNIFLRDAVEEDAVFLFDLVNDFECRNNSFHPDKVLYEEHLKWLKKILTSQTQKQYILVEGEKLIGQGRLELIGSTCRISYSVIPERRGCGYGKVLVQLLNNAIIQSFPDCLYSYGEVLKKNVSSQKIFEELGYEMEEREEYFYYQKQTDYYAEHQICLKKPGGDFALK